MHPLQPRYELENQQIPPPVPRRPVHILNDLPILIPDLAPRSTNFIDMGKQEILITQGNSKDGDADSKRILHRDVERQRRQEMSNLYASLRSLLPLEYIKGKRAISDHMHEAVKYIKSLEMNTSQLRGRRDGLIKVSNLSSSSSRSAGNTSDSSFSFPVCTNIAVNPCPDGLEILIGSSPKDEVFPLSRVLKMLLGEGLNVVSCISTIVGDMRVHTIRAEVSNDQPSSDHVLALHQKLTNMIDPGHSKSE